MQLESDSFLWLSLISVEGGISGKKTIVLISIGRTK